MNKEKDPNPYYEDGRRLSLLRQAAGYPRALPFAQLMGWPHSALYQFEAGKHRVPIDRALELRDTVEGFCPIWLWTGDDRGLGQALRKKIVALEAQRRRYETRLEALEALEAS